MKSFMFRFVCAALCVATVIGASACSPKESVVLTSDSEQPDTFVTEPITATVDPVMMTVNDLMPLNLETIAELNAFVTVSKEDGRLLYMVQNTTDPRQFLLEVLHDEAGNITKAVLSYGDTSAVLVGDDAESSITGGIRSIVLTDPLELAEMTMENLLTLDPTDVITLNNYAFTAIDATHRQYSVVNSDSGKRCQLDITLDQAGTVTAATLSYNGVSRDMLQGSMVAILDIMTEMEGVQQ